MMPLLRPLNGGDAAPAAWAASQWETVDPHL